MIGNGGGGKAPSISPQKKNQALPRGSIVDEGR